MCNKDKSTEFFSSELNTHTYSFYFFWLISLLMVWQELERRLALQEQDVAIMKTVKSEVARVPDLEKELKHLREDNAFLRSNTCLSF